MGDVGLVTGRLVVILRFWYPGVKYLRMRWRHSATALSVLRSTALAGRLHCISNLRDLAFFIDIFRYLDILYGLEASSLVNELPLPQYLEMTIVP